MSKTGRPNYRRGARGSRRAEHYITVRGERRDPPDLRKLSRAVIAIALREAEAKAEVHDALKSVELPVPAPDDRSRDEQAEVA